NTLAEPGTTFNLLELQGGTTTLLGEAVLPAGLYQAVRVVVDVDQSSITMNDGSQAVVDWQNTGTIALHAFVEDQLEVPVEGARIVIDFDVGRSFLPVASGFLFIPYIRAVNEAATGSITGTVRGSDGPTEISSPVPNASVSVYHSYSAGVGAIPIATGRTDDQGRYFIPFVTEGSYAVHAHPPAGFDAGRAVEGGVFVTAGDETTVDLTLSPDDGPASISVHIQGKQSIVVGESVGFFAYVSGENGDSVSTPLVQWITSDSRIASITGSGQAVIVTGNAPGLALILATSMGATDSVLVSVGLSDIPVETVEVTPLTQTINVGDSTSVQAIVRDADGQILAGRGIDWSISDASVVSFMTSFSGDFVVLQGLAPGTATIAATSEGKSGSATVVVK
ncbi:MAG: carboxypeptidase regulatory-like domain-containing protein, partial [Gemmatimonadota bacterium]